MLEQLTALLIRIDDIVWGIPLIVFIMGTGILLTVRLGALQFRHLGRALKYMVRNEQDGVGEVSSFGALCTAMAATVGTGNIVGVATAIVAGGPGALFWMEVAACFGMATKYAEGVLALKYRTMDEKGHALGGPFYYIENGMGKKWIWLAKLFAIFGVGVGLLGIGTFTQVNGIASAVKGVFDPNNSMMVSVLGGSYAVATIAAAIIVTVAVALVIIGGIKRIASVSMIIVPFMIVIYVLICISILIFNIDKIPSAIGTIVSNAFGTRAMTGGALGAMMLAMQKGIARGIFSNEAGLGSAPIAAAAAQTKEPVRQGLVSMTGTFMDTIVVCTMTGLAIIVTGSWNIGLQGVAVTSNAFATGLPWAPEVGSFILMACLIFFAFTTILGWDYYSERCLEYLIGGNSGKNAVILLTYRWLYILAVLIGPFLTLEAVWTIADIFNGLMAIPNLIALVTLNSVIVVETRSYFKKLEENRL